MLFDDKDSDWAVLAGDIVYAPVSCRLYTIVATSVDTVNDTVVTYTRLGGNGVCYTMSVDKFKDGRFVKVEG